MTGTWVVPRINFVPCVFNAQGIFSVKNKEGKEERMKEKLEQIKADALKKIQDSDALDKLNEIRVNYLGKKGELTAVLKGMKDVAEKDRPKVGQMVNETRQEIESVLEEAKAKMERAVLESRMKNETIDVTLPAKKKIWDTDTPIQLHLKKWKEFLLVWDMK